MSRLEYLAIDADNHYYEPDDAPASQTIKCVSSCASPTHKNPSDLPR